MDSATNGMLNGGIWAPAADVNFSQTLTNGNYVVYLWAVENHLSNYRSYNVKLEGVQVASAIGRLTNNRWARYGPYPVTVNDGTLNVNLQRVTGDPCAQGIEIWSAATPTPTPTPPVARQHLINVATRTFVQTGENVTIGGFVINGNVAKKVLIRGLGPSLTRFGVTGAMTDPVLRLFNSRGVLLSINDNWTSNRTQILATHLAPSDNRESALLATLSPGNYTAILASKTNVPGVALFELYDLDVGSSKLINLSTRGRVGTGDAVVIGGFVIGGDQPTKVLIRAIGPSLAQFGIVHPLLDPVLELRGSNGSLIFSNDNWRTSQAQQIAQTIPPSDNRESAIIATLNPGVYTAIVRGKTNSTGVAVVEVYSLQ